MLPPELRHPAYTLAALGDEPAVAAVLDAFPGASIVDVRHLEGELQP
jgi:hypothetical protein